MIPSAQATIGRNQGFLNPADYELLYRAAEKQSRMLSGLRKSLEQGSTIAWFTITMADGRNYG